MLPSHNGQQSSLVRRRDPPLARHLGEGLGAASAEGLPEKPPHFHADLAEDGRAGIHEKRGTVPDPDETTEEKLPTEEQVGTG